MKIAFKVLFIAACVVASSVNAESLRGAKQVQLNANTMENARQLREEDFLGRRELGSPVEIGEQVLSEVNSELLHKVSGKTLLAIAENVRSNSVSTENKPIADALKDVILRLYPGETVEGILTHVLPALQAEAQTETRALHEEDFSVRRELGSPVEIGEQVLLEVNNKLGEKVSGKKLLAIAEKVQSNSVSPENEPIAQALKDVILRLYPGETVEGILSHVVPALQEEAKTEH